MANKTQEKLFEERLEEERLKMHNTHKNFKNVSTEAEGTIKFLEEKLDNLQNTLTYYKNREIYLVEECEYRNNEIKNLNEKCLKAEKISEKLQNQIDNKFHELSENLHTYKEKELKSKSLIQEMKNHIKETTKEREKVLNEYEVKCKIIQ